MANEMNKNTTKTHTMGRDIFTINNCEKRKHVDYLYRAQFLTLQCNSNWLKDTDISCCH